jgi:ribA/ribD-fused uncharacterized protein
MSTITIRFYETNEPYGCFSNFSRHPLALDGREWRTSEHFFQASKFTNIVDVNAVHAAATPFLAAQIGRSRERSLRTDWEKVKDEIMLRTLRTKFTQHPDIQSILRSTAGAALVEHTANDRYWGNGGDGSGLNRLGVLLEQVRSELGGSELHFVPPPWIAFPDVERSDLFWRMGRGEDHVIQASRFRHSLLPGARAEYDAYFRVPDEWQGAW